jgi:hypothetical protein
MINTKFDFSKNTGSLQKAVKLVRTILEEGERLSSWTTSVFRKSRRINSAYGEQKKFKWFYSGDYKTLSVTYTDGREKPLERTKPTYYVIWIEGIEPKSGEKIATLTNEGHSYTTKMGEALRFTEENAGKAIDILRSRGVAEWTLRNCLHKVNYANKKNLWQN